MGAECSNSDVPPSQIPDALPKETLDSQDGVGQMLLACGWGTCVVFIALSRFVRVSFPCFGKPRKLQHVVDVFVLVLLEIEATSMWADAIFADMGGDCEQQVAAG